MKKAAAVGILIAFSLAGCATGSRGNAPGAQTGTDANNSRAMPATETLIPGVGSALFPDPAGR